MELLTGYVVFHWIATWANPSCDLLFRALTDLGYETFYYLVITPLFWVVDRRRAGLLFLLILVSGLLNTSAKLLVHTPRPDPALVRVLDLRPYRSGSNAFPSGHAQNAVVFWFYLADWIGRRGLRVLALTIVALISFSRLYLGVHFPIDIIGGLMLGGAIIALLPRVLEPWAQTDFSTTLLPGLALALASALLPLVLSDPTMAVIGGSFIGFMLGAVWLPQPPPVFGTTAQLSVGLAFGFLLLLGLSTIFSAFPTLVPLLLYVRVAALWVIALWLFPHAWSRLALPLPLPRVAE